MGPGIVWESCSTPTDGLSCPVVAHECGGWFPAQPQGSLRRKSCNVDPRSVAPGNNIDAFQLDFRGAKGSGDIDNLSWGASWQMPAFLCGLSFGGVSPVEVPRNPQLKLAWASYTMDDDEQRATTCRSRTETCARVTHEWNARISCHCEDATRKQSWALQYSRNFNFTNSFWCFIWSMTLLPGMLKMYRGRCACQ